MLVADCNIPDKGGGLLRNSKIKWRCVEPSYSFWRLRRLESYIPWHRGNGADSYLVKVVPKLGMGEGTQ